MSENNMNDFYEFYDNGKLVNTLDMSEWQCGGISGRLPVNEACGGCVGCILTQALHAGWHDFDNQVFNGFNVIKMHYTETK